MAKTLHRLTAKQIDSAKSGTALNDGGGLYYRATTKGGGRWTFRFTSDDPAYVAEQVAACRTTRQREMGLGAYPGTTLARARDKAHAARELVAQGLDPIVEAERSAAAARQRAEQEARQSLTFGAVADDYIKSHRPKYRNAKHAAQWEMTLGDTYCKAIRDKPVESIDTAAILAVLEPIWTKVPETASRLRGRIENVLDAAKVRGLRKGENPAAWRGHLKALLPARQKLTRGHHAALPYDDLPAFVTELRARQSFAALALELCILTATRSSETLNAEWSEFDLDKAVWTIPAARMKAGIAHRVPLTGRALDILRSLPRPESGGYVFPGSAEGKPLSNMAMTMLLRRMKREAITVHGFRSTFRDWASEQTSFPHETCEHALAHRISDKAEAAYRRGDQFDKRRKLMEAWADYCNAGDVAREKNKVVPLRAASGVQS